MQRVHAQILSAQEARNRLVEHWTGYLCDDRDNVAEMLRTSDQWQVPTFGPNVSDEQVAKQFADLDLGEAYHDKHSASMVLVQVTHMKPYKFHVVGEWEPSDVGPAAAGCNSVCLIVEHQELAEMLRQVWKQKFNVEGEKLIDDILNGDIRLPVLPECDTRSLAAYVNTHLPVLGGVTTFNLWSAQHYFVRPENSQTVYRFSE